jgi:hypothetical protein
MTMVGWRTWGLHVGVACALAAAACKNPPKTPTPGPAEDGTPRVVVTAATRYQTMTGWEATAQAGHDDSPGFLIYKDQLFDRAVDELGIDRLRVEIRSGDEYTSDTYADYLSKRLSYDEWRSVWYATINDNNDPFDLNMNGFFFSDLDNQIEKVVLPIKQRLEARGRRLYLNICYVSFTRQITGSHQFHHDRPEEYAEFVQATYRHLAERYGLVPDAWEISLEPDNVPHATPSFMRQAIVATGNRLASMGLTPRFIAPSTTSTPRAIDYADAIASGGPPRFWTELSYHRYADATTNNVRTIASRAAQYRVTTSMLEHIGSGYEDLHEDLTVGNNSAWAQYALAYMNLNNTDGGGLYYLIDNHTTSSPTVRAGQRTPYLAQYFRYVRAGAVRIGATSSDAAFDPVAFTNPDTKTVVVVKADRAGEFVIEGLAAGPYEVTATTTAGVAQRLGSVNAVAGTRLRVSAPGRGVVTIAGN